MSSVTARACALTRVAGEPTPLRMPDWQERFLRLFPVIRRQFHFAFLDLDPEEREEATQEAIADCLVAYRRLVQQGRESVASATSLARYAVAHVRTGRGIGGSLNIHDVTSRYCRWRTGSTVESLDGVDSDTGDWREILLADRRASPAELATARIDFHAWLESLSPSLRAVAETLATGETTRTTAQLFNVSSGRISQFRRLLQQAWEQFQSEAEHRACPAFA